jgi:hypothetical protein
MSKEIKRKQNKREREMERMEETNEKYGEKRRRYNYNTGIADSIRMF